jgi:hypothetical protein
MTNALNIAALWIHLINITLPPPANAMILFSLFLNNLCDKQTIFHFDRVDVSSHISFVMLIYRSAAA